jgi:hypothetical protein
MRKIVEEGEECCLFRQSRFPNSNYQPTPKLIKGFFKNLKNTRNVTHGCVCHFGRLMIASRAGVVAVNDSKNRLILKLLDHEIQVGFH